MRTTFSQNSHSLITVSMLDNTSVYFWTVGTGQLERKVQLPKIDNRQVGPIAITPGEDILVTSDDPQSVVHLWNLTTGVLTRSFHTHQFLIQSMALSSDGAILATGSYDGTVNLQRIQ